MEKKKRVKKVRELDVPKEKLSQYQDAFNMFDTEGRGTINASQMYKIMRNMGNPLSMDDINDMIKKVDDTGTGEVDFEHFVSIMQVLELENENEDEDPIIKAFEFFDRQKTGKISCQEFKYIITTIGEDLFSKSDAALLFKESDLTDDGEIDYRDFVKFWRSK